MCGGVCVVSWFVVLCCVCVIVRINVLRRVALRCVVSWCVALRCVVLRRVVLGCDASRCVVL